MYVGQHDVGISCTAHFTWDDLLQYSAGRGEADFLQFINEKTGAKRLAGGLLAGELGALGGHRVGAVVRRLLGGHGGEKDEQHVDLNA